ncbi:NAD(P)H-dependent oxidoreductase [Paenarthrobacter ureafaciens]|nr:NAD(P)H-dependent oxidoreductase [Paenarthrobacter ureafaciens]
MNVLLIDAHLNYPGWSEGTLNSTMTDIAKSFYTDTGHTVTETYIERGYDPQEEVQKHVDADLVILQTPWLGPRRAVQCLCEFRVREWTQEVIHESWHADTPRSRSSPRSGRAKRCSTMAVRWSRSSRSSRSPRRLGTAG